MVVTHKQQVPGVAREASLALTRESLRSAGGACLVSGRDSAGWRPTVTAPHPTLSCLDPIYRRLARSWPADELASHYQAAYQRGTADLPADEQPPDRPITLLATAMPRLISLVVAANVLHLLPEPVRDDAGLASELLTTVDTTATGSLHRCHLALCADGQSRGYDSDDWLVLAYDQAADWLKRASPTTHPPALIDHAQQAGRFAAVAIGLLDRDAASVPEALTDCLGHLLSVCVFADAATDRQ